MLVGNRRFVMSSSARYRAVSESTTDAATDEEDDKDCDDASMGGLASDAYESFSRCDLIQTDADHDTNAAPSRAGKLLWWWFSTNFSLLMNEAGCVVSLGDSVVCVVARCLRDRDGLNN